MIVRLHDYMSATPDEIAEVTASLYPGPGRRELHAVITPRASRHFLGQLDDVMAALSALSAAHPTMKVAYARFYLSDPINRAGELREAAPIPLYSVVGQTPLKGERLQLLVIMNEADSVEQLPGGFQAVKRGAYTDLWLSTQAPESGTSGEATEALLLSLNSSLSTFHSSLTQACLRTWFFVSNIDATYSGLVAARNEVFSKLGLTSATHFIASTGIGSQPLTPFSPLSFEALSTLGLDEDQIAYLRAPSHLGNTMDYGVAFERATAVTYADRRLIIISGTASIDPQGSIHAPGLIRAQVTRMADNVDALLAQGAARPDDIMHIILYVRDLADANTARAMIADRYPGVPCVAVQAAVCRPGWLVEMECIAMTPVTTPAPWPAY